MQWLDVFFFSYAGQCKSMQSFKVRIPIAMQRNLRQQLFTSVFPKIAAQLDFWRHFFIPEKITTSFPPALSRRFAIWIALGQRNKYRSTPLSYARIGNKCSFWLLPQCYRSAPLRKEIAIGMLTLSFNLWCLEMCGANVVGDKMLLFCRLIWRSPFCLVLTFCVSCEMWWTL
jgi:hypothetical protein